MQAVLSWDEILSGIATLDGDGLKVFAKRSTHGRTEFINAPEGNTSASPRVWFQQAGESIVRR